MQHHQSPSEAEHSAPTSPVVAAADAAHTIQPSSPRLLFSSLAAGNTTASSHRRIAIAVDLSDESAYAVKWAVQNYLRPGDAVILLHVRPTSVLYGADWGFIDLSVSEAAAAADEVDSEQSQQKLEEDFDAFTTTKAHDLAQPLVESHIPFKIHIVKDHDMKERLCHEVERLGLSAVIMGSRRFGASKRSGKGRLGSVSDYCVHHCVCPVVVVRYPDEAAGGLNEDGIASNAASSTAINKEAELHPVPEEVEFHNASDAPKGRSHAYMLKKLGKIPKSVIQPSKAPPKRSRNEGDPQASKKKRVEEILTVTSKGQHVSPSKLHISEDVLKHQCVGRRRAEELLVQRMNLDIEMTMTLNDWNNEFMKVKYLQGEYKKKYDDEIMKMKAVEEQLVECRAELAIMATSASLQNQQMDRIHIELVDAHTVINQHVKDQQILEEKIVSIKNENKRLQSLLSEKEAKSKSEQLPSRVIEEFKKSIAFKMIVQDQVQEARDHIYDVEVKALELECKEEGFIRGFLKGVRLVQRKTGAEIEGLTPSQASGDSSLDSDGDEVESEL